MHDTLAPPGDGPLARPSASPAQPSMVGDSVAMRAVRALIARVARSSATVLVTGESGTGKELVARAIHAQSGRSGPFVAINCAALPASLLESELFGHARGAFTDAVVARRGLLLEADGGTLFLDEIGEMPLETQSKLLRALQERTVRPVGGTADVRFDARVIAATHRDLVADVTEGRFREDLYYRILVVHLELPALRDRAEDIPALAQDFLVRIAARQGQNTGRTGADALDRLLAHAWPGNARELENAIEHAVAMRGSGTIELCDLPASVRRPEPSQRSATRFPDAPGDVVTMDAMQARYLQHVLDLVGGNKARAARLLGLDRRTLHRKLARRRLPV